MGLIHYYHIFCSDRFYPIVQEHFNACRKYGLLDEAQEVRIGLVGSQQMRDDAKILLRWFGDFSVVAEAEQGWEQVTLSHLQSSAQSGDVLFYAHTKGAFSGTEFAAQWRRTMCYENVVKWPDRVMDLANHTTSGAFWVRSSCEEHKEHQSFYGGNYWWTTGEYVHGLPPIRNDHRYQAEGWIGLHPNPNPFDCRPGDPVPANFRHGSL